MEALINMVPAQMQPVLDYLQLKQLKAVLESLCKAMPKAACPAAVTLRQITGWDSTAI